MDVATQFRVPRITCSDREFGCEVIRKDRRQTDIRALVIPTSRSSKHARQREPGGRLALATSTEFTPEDVTGFVALAHFQPGSLAELACDRITFVSSMLERGHVDDFA